MFWVPENARRSDSGNRVVSGGGINRPETSRQKEDTGNIWVQKALHRHSVRSEIPVWSEIRENHAVIRPSQQEAKTTISPT